MSMEYKTDRYLPNLAGSKIQLLCFYLSH